MKTPDEIKKGMECCKLHDCYDDADCSQCPYTRTTGKCVFVMHDDALAYIQQLEAKVPKWISVEERLPKEGKFVLLQYAKNTQNPTLHARNTMAVGRYEYGMFLVEGCPVKVTHWMPLPEPPEV